ncbi:MAG TPA: hypothetical protein VHY32_05840 [Caulobacteraceae bacterium]|jgi:hypothetical protein|nr:hypothetical protein [Caulobacteraceae bacterium]
MSGGLSAFASDLAGLVSKYVPELIGPSGAPLAAAGVTAIQALGQVGVAAIQHEIATIVAGGSAAAAPAPAS